MPLLLLSPHRSSHPLNRHARPTPSRVRPQQIPPPRRPRRAHHRVIPGPTSSPSRTGCASSHRRKTHRRPPHPPFAIAKCLCPPALSLCGLARVLPEAIRVMASGKQFSFVLLPKMARRCSPHAPFPTVAEFLRRNPPASVPASRWDAGWAGGLGDSARGTVWPGSARVRGGGGE